MTLSKVVAYPGKAVYYVADPNVVKVRMSCSLLCLRV